MSCEGGNGAMSSVPSHHVLLFCCSTGNACFLAILRRSFRFIQSTRLLLNPPVRHSALFVCRWRDEITKEVTMTSSNKSLWGAITLMLVFVGANLSLPGAATTPS